MGTEIKVWAIKEEKMEPLPETSLAEAGRKENQLREWIIHNPEILGENILIIGKEVHHLDLLGIDESGNTVIIELKREELKPREALAQALEYAANIATWERDKLDDVCKEYNNDKSLDDIMAERFDIEPDELDDLAINQAQRILLVGTSIDDSLQRMIEWLSNEYEMAINFILLKYVKTSSEELIIKTIIIPEEVEKEKAQRKQGKRPIRISDEPGTYKDSELKDKIKQYLMKEEDSPRRIKNILLPLCLKHDTVTRDLLEDELVAKGEAQEDKVGKVISSLSRVLSLEKNDFLRQVISYEKEGQTKDNYKIRENYKPLIKEILEELEKANR